MNQEHNNSHISRKTDKSFNAFRTKLETIFFPFADFFEQGAVHRIKKQIETKVYMFLRFSYEL
jgi:hypothetical protein